MKIIEDGVWLTPNENKKKYERKDVIWNDIHDERCQLVCSLFTVHCQVKPALLSRRYFGFCRAAENEHFMVIN